MLEEDLEEDLKENLEEDLKENLEEDLKENSEEDLKENLENDAKEDLNVKLNEDSKKNLKRELDRDSSTFYSDPNHASHTAAHARIVSAKRRRLSALLLLESVECFLLVSFSAFVLSQLVGGEHMCLPPPDLILRPESVFDDDEFVRFSLRSVIPQKRTALSPASAVTNTTDDVDFLERLMGCGRRAACACSRYRAGVGHCLPDRRLTNSDDSNAACFVFDCYQSPCLVSLILPAALLLKSIGAAAFKIVFRVDGEGKRFAYRAIRFLILFWIMTSTTLLCLYSSDLLQGLVKSPPFKLVNCLTLLAVARLVTPLTATKASGGSKCRRRLVFFLISSANFLVNLLFLLLPSLLLFFFRGCDKNPRNRITFRRRRETLMVSPIRHYWDEAVRSIYAGDFDVRIHDVDEENRVGGSGVAGSGAIGDLVQTRYDFNFISFVFRHLGTIALVDVVFVILERVVVWKEDFEELEEEKEEEEGEEEKEESKSYDNSNNNNSNINNDNNDNSGEDSVKLDINVATVTFCKDKDTDEDKCKDEDKVKDKGYEKDEDKLEDMVEDTGKNKDKGEEEFEDTDQDIDKCEDKDKGEEKEKGEDKGEDTAKNKGEDKYDKDICEDEDKVKDKGKEKYEYKLEDKVEGTGKNKDKGEEEFEDTDQDKDKCIDKARDQDKREDKGEDKCEENEKVKEDDKAEDKGNG